MKHFGWFLLILSTLALDTGNACGQNGPTKHSVILTWTQGTPGTDATGKSIPINYNCLYRGTAAGVYVVPTPSSMCSTSPVTTLTDTTVAGGTVYHFAVTVVSVVNGVIEESAFSNDVSAAIPGTPSAPTLNNGTVAVKELPKDYYPGVGGPGNLVASIKGQVRLR